MDDPILRAARLAARHFDEIRHLPVTGPARLPDLRQHLASAWDFAAPRDPAALIDDLAAMLRRGSVHVTHPRYFGLFNPSVIRSSIGAATLAAAFNPQTAAWTHGPAAYAIEQHVLAFLARRIGWEPQDVSSHFCSGGQEANTTAVVVALTHAFPQIRTDGVRALSGDPVLYVSSEAHHSFEKAAHVAGLGRRAVRRIACDADLRMDPAALLAAVRDDRAAGRLPFLAAATAGATSSGVVDPIAEIAAVCANESIWFHCDAAWGGGALLSPALRPHLAGIDRADSVTWDAHKWLQAPLGSGMFFTRHRDAPRAAFATDSAYMPLARGGIDDPFSVSHQWSRRAAGIAVFAAVAELGATGLAAMIDHMAAMGRALRTKLAAAGWRVCVETPLPVVCFTHDAIDAGRTTTSDIARAVNASAAAWISPTELADGRRVVRACITSHRTVETDLDALVAALAKALDA